MVAGMKHLVVIDGLSFLFRAYHAVRPLTRSDGLHTNALFGFAQMLLKVINDLEPDLCCVALDSIEKNFRYDIYPEYKAHRDEMDAEMAEQMPYFEPLIQAFNIPGIRVEGVEADDVIATLATTYGQKYKVTIVSSDKDLMQLLGGQVHMLDTMKNKSMGADEVKEKFGVGPDKVIEVQALIGDSSDNIPGVKGIGPKTAAKLIDQFGSLKGIYDHLDEVERDKLRENLAENKDKADISYQLVQLKTDVDIPVSEESLTLNPDLQTAQEFLLKLEFKTLAERLKNHKAMNGNGAGYSQVVEKTIKKQENKGKPQAAEYLCISDAKTLRSWLDKAKTQKIFAIDTETTSLDAMQAKLVGISMALKAGEAAYIPLDHVGQNDGELDFGGNGGQKPPQLDKKWVLEQFKPLLADDKVIKVGQNIKYDLIILENEGLTVNGIADTMVLSYCLDAGMGAHNMDALAKRHLDITPIAYKDICGTGKKAITFDKVPLDQATQYAAEDADITFKLYELLWVRLQKDGRERVQQLYEKIEKPLVHVLCEMERCGVKVDKNRLEKLSLEFGERIQQIEQKIFKQAGEEFNVNSPKQLGDILFDKMGLTSSKKSRSTNVQVLEKLAEDGHEIANDVLEFRGLSKLKSTYTEALVQDINPTTGRVHTSYNQAGAATGRLSSSDPNLQNIPIRTEDGRKIRQAFVPEKGYVMMSADYSQVELRLLAHMADVEGLKNAFAAGLDIHSFTAHQVFDVAQDAVTADQRRVAKAINFGLVYGMGATSLARQIGVKRAEAQEYIDKYFTRYAGVQQYMQAMQQFAREHGYVETLYGRRVHLPDINSTHPMYKAGAERAAINAPLQGSNADIIKIAMNRIEREFAAKNYKSKMLMQVHDELIFEVAEEELDTIRQHVVNAMENVVKLSVPLKVETGVGKNWDEAH